MSWITEQSDAYGGLILAGLEGRDAVEIVEREDGFIDASSCGTKLYLAPFRRWPSHHRAAMRFVRGRVLDVGCGAGRVALHLQGRGQEVVGIDVSPGAVEACRRRGVFDARLLSSGAESSPRPAMSMEPTIPCICAIRPRIARVDACPARSASAYVSAT